MKKIFLTLFMLLAVSALAACAAEGPMPQEGPQPEATLRGVIVSTEPDGVLVAQEDGGLYRIARDGALADYDDGALAPGKRLTIGFDGGVLESYPAQIGGVETAEIEEGEDLVGFYLKIIDDLWSVDSGLNGGATYLAFDLSACENLTDGEKEAIVWLASTGRGLEPLTGSFDELAEQGYIDKENLYFEDGLLIRFSEMAFEKDAFTFDVQKWRSGLGAYFFVDCAAKRGASGWEYRVGAEAIA